MTAREAERLTRVEERQRAMQDDLQEVKNDVKQIKELLQEDRDTHRDFVTKSGLARGIAKVSSVALTITVLFFLFFDHIKEWVQGK